MCTNMCTDMCTDVCIDMCTDMCTDMCIDICIDMCARNPSRERFPTAPRPMPGTCLCACLACTSSHSFRRRVHNYIHHSYYRSYLIGPV